MTRRTYVGMFSMYFLENNNKQPQAIHYKGGMYVHVTDKEKHCGRRNWMHGKFLCPDDQHPSESSVNIVFLQQTALICVYHINFVLGQRDHFYITVLCVYISTATKLVSYPGHCGGRGKRFPLPPQWPGYEATTKHTVVLLERLSPELRRRL